MQKKDGIKRIQQLRIFLYQKRLRRLQMHLQRIYR